ncbi:hypothetical protein [Sedimenticola hydrogenitrophicus]|jgi:hypothetical protein|uniref:hypothetical protein n=1 Tax=Sedimenticola hydrogenitrophicus TaxID=2967975 RepID=UPI0021A820B4|nr:hypothetical protein [Sedimenticola hydrogenitrophicus]
MSYKNGYIMQDQVRNQIPSLMACNLSRKPSRSESRLHLVSVAVVTSVYFLAMAISV